MRQLRGTVSMVAWVRLCDRQERRLAHAAGLSDVAGLIADDHRRGRYRSIGGLRLSELEIALLAVAADRREMALAG